MGSCPWPRKDTMKTKRKNEDTLRPVMAQLRALALGQTQLRRSVQAMRRAITRGFAVQTKRQVPSPPAPEAPAGPTNFVGIVSQWSGLSPRKIRGRDRTWDIVGPRQIVHWLEMRSISHRRGALQAIARRYKVNHATVMHSIQCVQNRYETERRFRPELEALAAKAGVPPPELPEKEKAKALLEGEGKSKPLSSSELSKVATNQRGPVSHRKSTRKIPPSIFPSGRLQSGRFQERDMHPDAPV